MYIRGKTPLASLCILLIVLYQRCISPFLPSVCRFYPSCSEYAMQAVCHYGAIKGSWLAFKRIVRCNPYCACGEDPLPLQEKIKERS